MRKFLKLLAAILIIACGVSAQTSAIWDGTADTDWYNKNPSAIEFIIYTAEELAGLAELINRPIINRVNFSGKTIKLGNNIMLNDTTNWRNWENTAPANQWTAIGVSPTISFNGIFDGSGYVISGAYINTLVDYQGLFGAVNSGTIKNLGLVAVYYIGNNVVGGLVGMNNGGTIDNCYVLGNISAISIAGGLVGYNASINNGGIIKKCYTTVNLFVISSGGGLVGRNDFVRIENSYTTGNVLGNSNVTIGGLIGTNQYSVIENCYSTGNVSTNHNDVSSGSTIGGLIGFNVGDTVRNCYATGNVSITMPLLSYSTSSLGGLIGVCGGTIENSYATGDVSSTSGNSYAGGLVGAYSSGGTIKNSYATGDIYAMICGGLVGTGGINSATIIKDSYATGDIYATTSTVISIAGGLVGSLSSNAADSIKNCYATGNVSAFTNSISVGNGIAVSIAGGLIGSRKLTLHGVIKNCYATGNVFAKTSANITSSTTAGGLVGENSVLILNSYATGDVSTNFTSTKVSTSFEGGLVGRQYSVGGTSIDAKNCYYDINISNQKDNSGKGEPRTTEQMKQQLTFVEWDFESVWAYSPEINNGYPYLRNTATHFNWDFENIWNLNDSINNGCPYLRYFKCVFIDHDYNYSHITLPATCETTGLETEKCEVCGKMGVQTRTISRLTDCGNTSIFNVERLESKYGIKLSKNPVSDKVQMAIIIPNSERVIKAKIAIYDMTGNVVFETATRGGEVSWNLTNSAGRNVANGSYLVVVKVKGASGESYAYSAKLGVKR
jgi:hypothetical protein